MSRAEVNVETYLEEVDGELVIKQEYLDKLKELKSQNDKVSKELKALSSAITKELQTRFNDTTKISGYNFTVKGGYYGVEFDLEKFKEEQFATYLMYLKPKANDYSYSLVSATRERKNVQ